MFFASCRISPPVNYLCGNCLESSSIKEALNIKKAPYETISRGISVNDPILRPGRLGRKVLARYRKSPIDVQVYNIRKRGKLRESLPFLNLSFGRTVQSLGIRINGRPEF